MLLLWLQFYCIPQCGVLCCLLLILIHQKKFHSNIYILTHKNDLLLVEFAQQKKLILKKILFKLRFVETYRIGTTLVWNGIRVILEVWKVLGFTHQDYGLQICWCITGTVLIQWIVLCLFWITHPTRYIVGYIIQKRFAEEFNQL